jgi:hypothetical protein
MRSDLLWLLVVSLAGCRPTTTVEAVVSLGCFHDQKEPQGRPNTSGRDLDGFLLSDTKMTTELCVQTCASKGFPFAGTQWRTECFCGTSYGKSGRAENCNEPCAGNPHEICGGNLANTVYRVR